ncbi:MAG: hypothetical protein JO066_15345 [Verrucomicrobia bacterium]|nr:hypothetical protein [Verrucomicrobiota bacterium]
MVIPPQITPDPNSGITTGGETTNQEKPHRTSDMITPIKAIKIACSVDLCTRFSARGTKRFSSRLNGFPLTASMNKKSLTDRL